MPSPASGASAATADIRTLALVGPQGAGKTSLAEALLARTGAIGAAGSLERGTTVSDFDPDRSRRAVRWNARCSIRSMRR